VLALDAKAHVVLSGRLHASARSVHNSVGSIGQGLLSSFRRNRSCARAVELGHVMRVPFAQGDRTCAAQGLPAAPACSDLLQGTSRSWLSAGASDASSLQVL